MHGQQNIKIPKAFECNLETENHRVQYLKTKWTHRKLHKIDSSTIMYECNEQCIESNI